MSRFLFCLTIIFSLYLLPKTAFAQGTFQITSLILDATDFEKSHLAQLDNSICKDHITLLLVTHV